MKRQWTNEELIADFTLSAKELDLIGDSKADHNLLGAACLLKYFQQEGRFPAQKQDIPPIVIVHLAQQLGVVPEKIIPYDWEGRTIKAHRAAIRTFLGVHEATLADQEALVEWLCQEVLTEHRQEEALIASLYARCKEQLIDPPTLDRVRRLVHTAIHRFDERLCATIMQRLSLETRTQLDALLTVDLPEAQAREETVSALEEASSEVETAEAAQESAPSRPQSALHALKQTAHGDGQVPVPCPLQSLCYLRHIRAVRNECGVLVDPPVPNSPGSLVAGVFRADQFPMPAGLEAKDRGRTQRIFNHPMCSLGLFPVPGEMLSVTSPRETMWSSDFRSQLCDCFSRSCAASC
jgi:Domain of unknown function (DUF4158)